MSQFVLTNFSLRYLSHNIYIYIYTHTHTLLCLKMLHFLGLKMSLHSLNRDKTKE